MSTPPRPVVAAALGGLLSLAAAMGIGRFVYTPILPYMTEGLGLAAGDAGLIASANFLGYLAGALLAASRTFSRHPRAWFLAGLLASAVTSAAMATTPAVTAFVVIRFLSGIASAFVLVFSTTLVLDRLAAAGRTGFSALHFAGVGCGIALSAVMVASLGFSGAGWRQLWLASGAATLLLMVSAMFLVPGGPDGSPDPAAGTRERPSRGHGAASLPWTAGFLRFVIAYGLFGFGYVITATFVSAMARTTPSLAAVEGLVWLIVGLCAAPSVLVWNRIAQALNARRAFALACLIEAAGVAMTALSQHPAAFLTGAGLLGGTFMGITALGLVEARRAAAGATDAAPRLLAVMTASFGLGQMIGPTFAGQLHALTGSFQAASLAAAAALVMAAALAARR